MRRAIQKHLRDFLAIIAIAVIAILVGGYILSNQRFYAPAWVPLIGSDFVDYQAQMATAQAFTAGQGQTVMIAGVPVGEIGKVTLKDGRALITMKMKRKYTPIYKDATVLSRPKTGLNDMTLELDPGNPTAGRAAGGRHHPDLADAAERQPRRVPRRPRHRDAQLHPAADRRRRRRASTGTPPTSRRR